MRVFISHSSKDKSSYCDSLVTKLSEKLGKSSIVYDELTFEAGEKSLDEINRTLAITDLYVILLSEHAMESSWVKYELAKAKEKLDARALNRVYPLIIDPALKFSDKRIPEWVREYNLKYIARPAKAAKLIIERAKDVNWSRHPEFQIEKSIFVGRNDLINDFERRIDDFDKPPLNTFIVSGIPNIGRKTLARQCFIKGNIIQQYYDFPVISLSYQESIEDFIIKLNDLGFTDCTDISKLSALSMECKVQLAIDLSAAISNLSEIVLIKDDGCIVDYRGNPSDWFKDLVASESLVEKITFLVITKYKTTFETVRNIPSAWYMNVPELSQQERKGLLRRLADANSLDLSRVELEQISKHLTGYPAQVHRAIEIIKDSGFPYLSRNYKLLSDYNEQEVSSLLEKHKADKKVFEILALIAKYDAISLTMLYEILETTPGYVDCYEELYQESFFELEGVNREYVRLNEVIRNYVLRSGAKVSPVHQKKAHDLFEKMFSDNEGSWYDSNDFLLAIRSKVIQGKRVDMQDVIPSVYLKSMSDLYANMQYENVVKLAKLALSNSDNTDQRIQYEIQYTLCSALAKLKHSDFLSEVNKLEYDGKKFLMAFYYRQIGKNDKALACLNELLAKRPDMSKAKREKVLVLKNLQEFEQATGLAKENYYLYSDNPYHIQAYFDCLINTYHVKPENNLLADLLEKLGRISSEKAQSMYCRCNALYIAYVDRNCSAALKMIDEAIVNFPKDKKYALIVKFDIARQFQQFSVMTSVIRELEADRSNENTIVICRSKLLADQNKVEEAVDYFNKNISFFTEESKKAFCEKLRSRGTLTMPMSDAHVIRPLVGSAKV